MDCKIVIILYYYFQLLQSENVGNVKREKFNFELPGCTTFGSIMGLCDDCKYQSDVKEIYQVRSLFVNLTFGDNLNVKKPFNVTITTQIGKEASSGDKTSQTRSFNSLKVNFQIEVTEDHNHVMIELEGEECGRILDRAEMYYYFIPKQTRLLTVFPSSSAPSMSKEPLFVGAQCESNAGYEKKPTMKIYSNGTFELQGSCECNRGFELNGTNCSGGQLFFFLGIVMWRERKIKRVYAYCNSSKLLASRNIIAPHLVK